MSKRGPHRANVKNPSRNRNYNQFSVLKDESEDSYEAETEEEVQTDHESCEHVLKRLKETIIEEEKFEDVLAQFSGENNEPDGTRILDKDDLLESSHGYSDMKDIDADTEVNEEIVREDIYVHFA